LLALDDLKRQELVGFVDLVLADLKDLKDLKDQVLNRLSFCSKSWINQSNGSIGSDTGTYQAWNTFCETIHGPWLFEPTW